MSATSTACRPLVCPICRQPVPVDAPTRMMRVRMADGRDAHRVGHRDCRYRTPRADIAKELILAGAMLTALAVWVFTLAWTLGMLP